ncbi:hypothetical protein ACFV90_36830 [Streptomyces sp. NPDC059904]|uniref:hypothetical protein n=1 Tax=Streptomyces sp. NPDC059904 TaxID=3346996 RepID=UPI0036575F31
MSAVDLRALALGQRLFCLLQDLDSMSTSGPLLEVSIRTAAGFEWDLELSERAVERLTDPVAAAEARPQFVTRPALRLVPSAGEAS